MSEEIGPVEGAEPVVVSEAPVADTQPEVPVTDDTQKPERSKSTSDSLDRALKQINERSADDRPRTPDGKFAPKADAAPEAPVQPQLAPEAPKPAEPAEAPPARLRADVKAEWEKLPPNVRSDFTRITGELEKGLQQYREQIEPYKPFLENAQRAGIDPVAWIDRASQLDRACAAGPVQGVDALCKMLGVDMRALAAHVMGQPAPERDAHVTQLQQENAALRQKAEAYDRHLRDSQTKAQADAQRAVEEFTSKPEAARFEELAETVAWLLSTGGAKDLASAYQIADRLRPAPQAATAAPVAQTHTPAAQTRNPAPQTSKAGLSLEGAPGSNAATSVKSKSNLEALTRAAAKVGLSL